jgi:hypothetical protein
MPSRRAGLIALSLLLAWGAAPVAAQTQDSTVRVIPPVVPTSPDFPRGRISGYMFGDLYYNLDGDPRRSYNASGADLGQTNIDGKAPIAQDLNGAQMRRVYLQLDNDLTARIATRFRLEADGKELTSGGKVGMFVKNAYIVGKSVYPRGDLYFGMLTTPTFENTEEFWQYRSVEKTLADFWGLNSSSDFGIEAKGFVDPDHHVGYSAMIGDGNGQKTETDRFKRWYLNVPVRVGDLRIEPGVDYMPVRVNLARVASHTDSLAMNNDLATYRLFAGYEFRRVALGVEGIQRIAHKVPSTTNVTSRGFSVFARGRATETSNWFARVDQWSPEARKVNRVDTRLFIAGVDWQPVKDVHIMPNLEATQYVQHGTGAAPKFHDLQARVTFYYRFSRPQS